MNDYEKFLNKKDNFILDENNNAIPANLMEWGEFFNNTKRRIVNCEKINGMLISTIFVGIDHNFYWDDEEYKPHIFETMVFKEGSYLENYCERCSTWQEAEECHKKAVQWVKDGCKEDE